MDSATVEELAQALEDTAAVVRGVGEEQWHAPTACDDWDVHGVVQHLAVGHEVFARALRGEAVTTRPEPPAPPLADAYTGSAATLVEAFRARGDLEGEVTIPFGTVPATVALHLRLVEALVHGWDVAVATGQQQPYDERLAEQELAFSRTFVSRVPPGRTPFAPSRPVPDDASPIDRLAALLGRDVTRTARPSGTENPSPG